MTQTKGSLLDSLERKASSDEGLYGSMVADQNYIATFGHNCNVDDECVEQFDRMNGPVDGSYRFWTVNDMRYDKSGEVNWEELEKYNVHSWECEDFELTPQQVRRLQLGMNVDASVTELVPHLVGRKAYFREVDAFRKRILACYTLEALYEIIDETIQLDDYMITTVDGWKPVKTTFERLEPQLTKVEKRIREREATFERERLARETYLIKIGYIKKESEPIGV